MTPFSQNHPLRDRISPQGDILTPQKGQKILYLLKNLLANNLEEIVGYTDRRSVLPPKVAVPETITK